MSGGVFLTGTDTGCGKTHLVELLFGSVLKLPTVVVDVTTYSETGYVGQDPSGILTRLLHAADDNPLIASIGIVCLDEFDKIAAENDNFDWHLVLSDPQPEDNWEGLTGFIHNVLYEEYLKDHPAPEDCEYYLCGPPMMLQACMKMLDDLGVEPENILFDDFGT